MLPDGDDSPYDTAHGRRYRVRYRTPDRRQTDKRGFKTKRDAELFLASVEISKARGEFVEASESAITIGALGTVWLDNQSHLKPSSKKPLEVAWHKYVEPGWGRVRVRDVRFSEVQNWVTRIWQDRSATVVLRAYGVLAGILDVAARDRRITSNPARGVNLPRKVAKPHVYLSHEQVNPSRRHLAGMRCSCSCSPTPGCDGAKRSDCERATSTFDADGSRSP